MFTSILCTVHNHDWRIVGLAVLVCAFATATSMRLLRGANGVRRDLRVPLMLAAGACGGAGVWVTHFVAMLGFEPGVATGFDPAGTLLSFLIAVLGGGGSVWLMFKAAKPWRDTVWSISFGLSAALMHYVGMAALRLPGHLTWNPILVLASMGFGVALSATSRITASHFKSRVGLVISIGLLVIAICGLHLIGMSAVTIVLDPSVPAPLNVIPHDALAIGVSGLTLLIGLVCSWTIWFEARARRSSRYRIHAMLDALPQAVAYFDEADRYALGNDAFENELMDLGLNPGEKFEYRAMLLRVQAKDMTGPGSKSDPIWVEDHLEARRHGDSVLDHALADGRVLRVETRRASIGGYITVLSDITDLKRQAADLETARDAAETAGKSKSQFLANMSHELRTPMNGVIGIADLLAQEQLTPKQREFVKLIQSSGRILDRVLLDLLDIAQIESGVLEIVEAPFDVTEAVGEVVQIFAAEAVAKDLTIAFHPMPLVHAHTMGDVDRLKQILSNLVANAVKFTEKGRVDIALATLGEMTVITVADTGIGFDPTQKERLFNRFEQADSSNTRRYGGAGLGLPIARDLATRMGGALTCDSTPGAGSVFFLSLPLRPADSPTEPGTSAPGADAPEAGPIRILVVDDVPANRQVLSLMLDGAGIETAMAENGLDTVAQWRRESFDAILMDIQMPVMDGLTAVRTIRELERAEGRQPTPIIMVSANAMPEHVSASLGAGANNHLAKPITAARLFSALEQLDQPEPAIEDRAA